MNKLKKILFQHHILEFNTNLIEQWKDKLQISNLEFALQNGNFKIREQVLIALGKLKSVSSTELIIENIDDKVEIVSLAAINALNEIGTNSKINNIIEDKLNYWEKKKILEIERRENNSHHKSSEILKWERTSKKTYENMKEMIKMTKNR